MEANRFCIHCGKALAPGARFCQGCGAEWQAPDATAAVPPGAAAAKTPLLSGWRLWTAVVAAVLVAFFIVGALVSEDEKPASNNTSSSSASTPPATAGASTPAATATVAGTPRPRATSTPQGILTLRQMTPVAMNVPAAPAGTLGSNNYLAADQIKKAIATVIPDLGGVEIKVQKVSGSNDTMLRVNLDEAATRRFPSNPAPVLNAITSSSVVKDENITRLELVMSSRDERGPMTIIALMSMATAAAVANNSLSQAEMQKQVQLEVTRP